MAGARKPATRVCLALWSLTMLLCSCWSSLTRGSGRLVALVGRGGSLPQRVSRVGPCRLGVGGVRRLATIKDLDEVSGVALRHTHVQVADDVTLHVVEAGRGESTGASPPTVCLLHGFPDFWLSWRRQLPSLVDAGFRVICPDLRGYAQSSKPKGIARYSEVEVVDDIEALRKHFCGPDGQFELLCGHDWGAAVAWSAMSWYPGLAKRLAILNVPHPQRFKTGLLTPQQLLKSWYIFVFQLPALPEFVTSAGGASVIRGVFTYDPDEPLEAWELDRYTDAAAGRGGMQGAINYYRAAMSGLWPAYLPDLPPPLIDLIQSLQGVTGAGTRGASASGVELERSETITCPVLVLWGERDRYLGQELAAPPRELVPHCQLRMLDATHWVHWDRSEEVAAALSAFALE